MKHIGVTIVIYLRLIVLNFFSKWPVAKAIKNEFAPTAAALYKLSYDLGKEIVNQLAENLQKETGTEQRTTSAYQSESKGLCECQNRSI